MAESQVPYPYDAAQIAALRGSLSEPRFATYLIKASGNEPFALALYLYNSRLAKSFLFPLGVAEVTMRNAVDGVLVEQFGTNWHQDNNFRNSVLTPPSLLSLEKAIDRAKSLDRGKVVAELTFDFWSNLFRTEYAALWRTKANRAFPGLAHGEGRREIQAIAREINLLRNRVAHHEPILDVNAPDLHSKMIKLTELRCSITAKWMRHHSTVGKVMRTRPTLAGSAPATIAGRADTQFHVTKAGDSLLDIAGPQARASKAYVCIEGNNIVGAFAPSQLFAFIGEKATAQAGLVDLTDYKVSDLLNEPDVSQGHRTIGADAPFLDAVEVLKEPKTRVLVAVSPTTGAPVGIMLRAHRRY